MKNNLSFVWLIIFFVICLRYQKTLTMESLNTLFSCWSEWHSRYYKNEPFQAILVDGELQPFEIKDKDVFVYGKGRIKFGKKKKIEVPSVTDETNLQDYLNTYGRYCLYYGLTRHRISCNDCCWTSIEDEFVAMVALGFDKWIPYMKRVTKLNTLVESIYKEKYGISGDNEKLETTKRKTIVFRDGLFNIHVRNRLHFFVRYLPHFDVVEDDERLYRTFKLCEVMKDGHVDESIDLSIFPVSVKDRLTYLFSEEVSNEYSELMHYFTAKDLEVTN